MLLLTADCPREAMPYQGGICEGDDDVCVKLIQHGAFDGPDSSGVARQG